MDSLDKIEERVVLHAPVSRVWKAISNAKEFGQWFDIELEGRFEPGKTIRGSFAEGFSESALFEYQKSLGLPPSKIRIPEKNMVFCTVERLEPEHYFSFRWIPYGIDAEADPKTEPTTLVEFRLEKIPEGTLLTITESGFNKVPAHRRERAFRMNKAGWSAQAENIKNYVQGK